MRIPVLTVLSTLALGMSAEAKESEEEQSESHVGVAFYSEANFVVSDELEFPIDAVLGVGVTFPIKPRLEWYAEFALENPFTEIDIAPRLTTGPNFWLTDRFAIAVTILGQLYPPRADRAPAFLVGVGAVPSYMIIPDRLVLGLVMGTGIDHLKVAFTLALNLFAIIK